jgi:hypothetical protein
MMSLSLEEKGRDLFEKIEDVDFDCIEFRLLEAGGGGAELEWVL